MEKFIVTATIETIEGVVLTARIGTYYEIDMARLMCERPTYNPMFQTCLSYFVARNIGYIISCYITKEV